MSELIKKFNEGTVAVKNLFWFGMGIFFIALGYFKVQDHIHDTQMHWTADRNKRFWQLATKADVNTKVKYLQLQLKELVNENEKLKTIVQELQNERELFDFRIRLNERKIKQNDNTSSHDDPSSRTRRY